ncbi:MAG: hypothetical protein FWG05_01795 [Kiritimatiellaeota bacterium]|nr:hypothetical protein [Kiritimatiellota bacterium]
MTTVNFLGFQASRLIVGGNPFMGFSYIQERVSRDEMLDYYTIDRIIKDLKYAETLGYTHYINTCDEYTRRFHRQYRNEGGKLGWIAQTHSPQLIRTSTNIAIEGGACAYFHQGSVGDGFMEQKQYDVFRAELDDMRRANIPIGIATHVPEHIMIQEEKNFGVDFYMACCHNLRKGKEGRLSSSVTGKKDEEYDFRRKDREEMFKVVRQLNKPCIAYKILGGGTYINGPEDTKALFKETYDNIKPGDIATVGVFQRDRDQLKENAEILKELGI